MLDALARGDFGTIERLGHRMRGCGASFGFQTITDIGAALEQDARRADTDATHKGICELSTYLVSEERLAPSAPGTTDPAACTKRILLIEDDADAREVLCGLLEDLGHQVRGAVGGVDGLKTVSEFRPDVVFIDVGLPDMDGHEVARQVRAASVGRDVRLIALTGYGGREAKTRALEAGFDQHVLKPIQLVDLSEILKS